MLRNNEALEAVLQSAIERAIGKCTRQGYLTITTCNPTVCMHGSLNSNPITLYVLVQRSFERPPKTLIGFHAPLRSLVPS